MTFGHIETAHQRPGLGARWRGQNMGLLIVIAIVALLIVLGAARSFHSIGPAEVGLVTKRVGAQARATTSSSPSTARPATRPTC